MNHILCFDNYIVFETLYYNVLLEKYKDIYVITGKIPIKCYILTSKENNQREFIEFCKENNIEYQIYNIDKYKNTIRYYMIINDVSYNKSIYEVIKQELFNMNSDSKIYFI